MQDSPRTGSGVSPRAGRRTLLGACWLLASCAGAAPGGSDPVESDAVWRALAAPRPAPLPGAARVTVGAVQLLGQLPWDPDAPVSPELGVAELVAAGLLTRRDVHFVERRRFAAAVEAERTGRARRGAPPAGVSPGAEFVFTATWVPLPTGPGSIELRLADARTGAVAGTGREVLRGDPNPIAVARTVVRALLGALAEVGRLPDREDPSTGADGIIGDGDMSGAALQSFLRGLAAEESWQWEEARRGYQTASQIALFPEAEAALARTARLRLGGTLGEN